MIEQVTSGIDWLTLTLPWGAPNDAEWVHRGQVELMRIQGEGYSLEERSLLGYRGYSCGNCFVGEREDGRMMQFTGRHADKAFEYVYRRDAHISRVDVQVTVKYDVMPQHVAERAYRSATHTDSGVLAQKRRKLFLITGSDGGETVYVGAATSAQRGRLYNKEVQSEDTAFGRTWRYEVVLRNERAQQLCNRLHTEGAGKITFISDYVALWYESRSIEAPWCAYPPEAVLEPLKTLPNDIERQFTWLRTQVRPTVIRLLSGGYRDILMVSLGLRDGTEAGSATNELV